MLQALVYVWEKSSARVFTFVTLWLHFRYDGDISVGNIRVSFTCSTTLLTVKHLLGNMIFDHKVKHIALCYM